MHRRASAFIVGLNDGPGAALMDLARSIGFAASLAYTTIAAAEAQAQHTPLIFLPVRKRSMT